MNAEIKELPTTQRDLFEQLPQCAVGKVTFPNGLQKV
jgi:hypothetical protein